MRRLADDLFQLRGFPPHVINVYLMGGVLVDAGTRHAARRILRQLRGQTVTAHALTHAHADHQGSSRRVCEALGLPLWCGAADAEAVEAPGAVLARMPDHWVNRTIGPWMVGPPCPVARRLCEGDEVGGFTVIETPGHTAGHICFYLPEDKLLFAADTLFALGCGRLFERPAKDMWTSLSKLLELPDDVDVYFGHEYTLSNARFAVTVDPDGSALRDRVMEIDAALAAGKHTAPTTIGIERRTNPFLRPGDPVIRKHLGMEQAEDWEVFGEIQMPGPRPPRSGCSDLESPT